MPMDVLNEPCAVCFGFRPLQRRVRVWFSRPGHVNRIGQDSDMRDTRKVSNRASSEIPFAIC